MSTNSPTLSFDAIIPIGFFCGPTEWLEALDLRKQSNPFDWVITDLDHVSELIANQFHDLFDEAHLLSHSNWCNEMRIVDHDHYMFRFFHDFPADVSIAEKLPEVREKYERRITRFYNMLKDSQSLLFIRYVRNDDDDEARKMTRFIEVMTALNPNFKLIVIKNTDSKWDERPHQDKILRIFEVEKDPHDCVKRQLPEALQLFLQNEVSLRL